MDRRLAGVLDEVEYVSAGSQAIDEVCDSSRMNEVYGEMVGSPFPVRATVRAQLMAPEALGQIVMLAAK